MKFQLGSLILSLTALCQAGETTPPPAHLGPGNDEVPRLELSKFIDVLSVRGVYNGGLEFNELTQGDVDFSQANVFGILGLVGRDSDLTWVPTFNYRYSNLDVNPVGPAPGFDDSLHEILFPSFLLYNPEGSRWFHGLFSTVGIRSDLGTIDSRDFFLSAAIGSGYQFSDNFTLGFGVYASDITNAPFLVAAPVFFWTPTEDWLISYFGPRFIARREFGPDVRIGFEAGWNGGAWNVDSPTPRQDSLRVDFRSIRAGIFYRQRIHDNLWGEVGVGYSFANELKVNSPGGRDLFPTTYGETDGAPYFSLGLSLNRW